MRPPGPGPARPVLRSVPAFAAAAVLLAGAGAAYVLGRADAPPAPTGATAPPGPRLAAISPRLLSNQTAYPVTLYGEGLTPGLGLTVEGLPSPIPTAFVDDRHLTAVLPAGLPVPERRTFRRLRVGLSGRPAEPGVHVDVVSDAGYPLPHAIEVTEDRVFVASPTTDTVWTARRDGTAPPEAIPVGDGPAALARWGPYVVVGHRFESALRLLDSVSPLAAPRAIPLPAPVEGLRATDRGVVATSSRTGRAYEVALPAGDVVAERAAGVRPRAVDVQGDTWVVGDRAAGSVWVSGPDGGWTAAPDPSTAISGGRTARYGAYVMGGTYPRALAIDGGLAYVASIGPNIGPNPDRMEVSMNGGVGVVDLVARRFVRHVSLGQGIPQALALDPVRRRLYAADVSRDRLVVLSLPDLAVVRSVPLPAPAGADQPHTAPWDLRLADGGATAVVLERLTGRVTEVPVAGEAPGRPTGPGPPRSYPVVPLGPQRSRRAGEALYLSDVAATGMSCDACHPDGHDGGVLFTKSDPLHIYRAPSLRSARETAPYFTPALFPTLEHTAREVLARNRFHAPAPSATEVRALALYQAAITAPPNPLRDGATGAFSPAALRGLSVFEGPGGCAGCHPAPMFTTDQDPATRGRLYDVGTPVALGLRPELQDAAPYPLPAPTLVGVWDAWPLLHSGAAGIAVDEAGTGLRVAAPDALPAVFALPGVHGGWNGLTQAQRGDLIAYVRSL